MQVGKACGYSASAVSRIESGRLRVDYPTLMRLAMFLRIAPEQLRALAVPGMANVATVAGGCRSVEEDEVRRRELLTGAVAAGATAVVGARPAAAAEPVDLEVALFRLPQVEPVPLPRLVGQVSAARRDFLRHPVHAAEADSAGSDRGGDRDAGRLDGPGAGGGGPCARPLVRPRGRAGDEAALRRGVGGGRPGARGRASQRHPGGRR
nr:helix-turn-helix transcriptional regulator [Streptomyces sp. SID4946]